MKLKTLSLVFKMIFGELLPSNKKYLSRWIALKLLDENELVYKALKSNFDIDIANDPELNKKILRIKRELNESGIDLTSLNESIVMSIVSSAEDIRKKTCTFSNSEYNSKDRKLDKILTSKKFGIPIMIAFFAAIFWITITGANYPSSLLSSFFGFIQEKLLIGFEALHVPEFWTNLIVLRYVSNCNLGCSCYAPTYGDIFSFVYITRRPWISPKNLI